MKDIPGNSRAHADTQRTIMAVRAMGVDCDRTVRGREFRLTLKTSTGGVSVGYASTHEQALAMAKRMKEGVR